MWRRASVGALVFGLAAGGAGGGCGSGWPAEVSTGFGATRGPLTISGHLRDGAGNGVVGGRLALYGDTRAVRVSNFTGGFVFHVEPGAYQLAVSGDCGFAPASVALDARVADVAVDVVATDGGCVTSRVISASSNGKAWNIDAIDAFGGAGVGLYDDAEGAVASFDTIASETNAPIRRVIIAGRPALERLALISHRGPLGDPTLTTMLVITTAIAVGNQVVRFETQVQPDAPAATIALVLAAGRSFSPEEIGELRAAP